MVKINYWIKWKKWIKNENSWKNAILAVLVIMFDMFEIKKWLILALTSVLRGETGTDLVRRKTHLADGTVRPASAGALVN